MQLLLLFLWAKDRISDVYSVIDLTTIFYLFLIISIFLIIGASLYQGKSKILYRHFIANFFLKIFGCLAFIALYTFYYGYGDTFRYYTNAKPIISMASQNPTTYIQTLLDSEVKQGLRRKYPEYNEIKKRGFSYNMHHTKTNYLVVRFAAFFGTFSFGSYITISLFFAALSSLGVWALYRTFTGLFPGHENALSIPVIYFPSLWFWGSSIMKDSLVICFLGFLTYSLFKIFIKKENFFFNGILLSFSIYVLLTTKEYVIIAFVPALLLWLILSVSNRLPNWFQIIVRPTLLVLAVGAIFVIGPKVGQVSDRYALEQVLETAENTGRYIYSQSVKKDGSAYSLGEVSYTPQGLVSLFPKAVSVTLFRPFIFEVKNLAMLMSAIESTFVLFFTIFVIFRVGVVKIIFLFFDRPFLLAALVFSIFFAFAIGASTFNFGALARYKIPCLPFYGLAIIYPYSLYRFRKKRSIEKL